MRIRVIGCMAVVAVALGACDDVTVTAEWNPLPLPLPLQEESPAGIFRGTFTDSSHPNPVAQPVTAIIDADGNTHIYFAAMAERHIAGRVDVFADLLTGDLTEYSGTVANFIGSGGVDELAVEGSVSTGVGITGEYSADTHAGRFVLDYQAIHDTPSSLALTAGVWSFNTATSSGLLYTVVWEIDESGAVFGTDTLGCDFVGNVSVGDPLVNVYTVSVQVGSCAYFNGDYSGLAFLSSAAGPGLNSLTLSMANDIFAYTAALQK